MNTDRNLALAYILTVAGIEDLNSVIAAVKARRETLGKQAKGSIKAGTKVTFTSKGTLYRGTVTSVKVKRAVVECELPGSAYDSKMRKVSLTTSYRVPLSMLQAA
jgi:hypothetical protein